MMSLIAWPFEHPLNLFAIVGWVLLGATFSEAIRAFVRKVTKGRFFGAVPASKSTPIT